MSQRYFQLSMYIGVAGLLLSILCSLLLGNASISLMQLWQTLSSSDSDLALQTTILWQIRLPRILTAVLAGAGLAIAGSVLQNVSRNPLADPYLFGLMAGAGLGATLVSVVLPQGQYSLALGAFIGALFAVVLVFVSCAGRHWRRMDMTLLAGVAVSFMLSAISSFILYFAEPFAANRIMFWLMGSLSRANWHSVMMILPVLSLVTGLAFALRRQLDVLLLGDESARALGAHPLRLRVVLLVATALLTAVIVSQCGGIAFVGLMVPHIVRHSFGVTAVRLLCGCILVGAIFMIWVDNLARTVLSSQEIPLGVITSLVGSVFFLILMRRQADKSA